MIGVGGGVWGPLNVSCDTPMIANDVTLMRLRLSLEWVQGIHSKAAESQSGLHEVYMGAYQWRYINGQMLLRVNTCDHLKRCPE